MKKINLILILICNFTITLTMANPGNYQINQACLAVGCFNGDDPNTNTVEITKSSGTFVLTSDIGVSANGNPAILISPSASNMRSSIVIDLNGFRIYHSGIADNSTHGIFIEDQNSIVTIKNGKISAFWDGINTESGASVIVENMIFRIMRDDAISTSSGVIRNNVFDGNKFGIFSVGALSGTDESILIDSNLFMGTENTHQPTAGMPSTNLCTNNIVNFTDSVNFGLCTLSGINLCRGVICTTSTNLKNDEAKD